jgi:hypothetical protein
MTSRLTKGAIVGVVAAVCACAQLQPKSAEIPKNAEIGTVVNGQYHHNLTGVEFTLPAGWSVLSQGHAAGPEEGQMIDFKDPDLNAFLAVWLKPQEINVDRIPYMLDHAKSSKVNQRTGFQGYTFRPESLHRTVGGQQALSAVADYIENGREMVEYLTWVFSARTHIVFIGRARAGDLELLRTNLDFLIDSSVVP